MLFGARSFNIVENSVENYSFCEFLKRDSSENGLVRSPTQKKKIVKFDKINTGYPGSESRKKEVIRGTRQRDPVSSESIQ